MTLKSHNQDTIAHGEVKESINITVPADTRLRATLAWDDPAAAYAAAKTLINNLDLSVARGDGFLAFPSTLNPTYPWDPAFPGVDTINNVEQVDQFPLNIISSCPISGSKYRAKVTGTSVRKGPQEYSLVFSTDPPCTRVRPEMKHWYRLDDCNGDQAIDSIGGENASWNGTSPNYSWQEGKVNGALHLGNQAIDNWFETSGANLYEVGASDFTLVFWYKPESTHGELVTSFEMIQGDTPGYQIELAGGKLNLFLQDTAGQIISWVSPHTVSLNEWHLFGAAVNRAQGWIDVFTGDSGQSLIIPPSFGTLGHNGGLKLGGATYLGEIDEVKMFSSYLPEEILTSFQRSTCKFD